MPGSGKQTKPPQDFLSLKGVDYLEFYVGNARQAAYYYRCAFGMTAVAYRGPETGERECASYVLEQDRIRFVFTSSLQPDHPVAEHARFHGDGVRDIALTVDNAESAYRETTKRGARGVMEPVTLEDEHGQVRKSAIATYGDTIHTFVERNNYQGSFMPGFVPMEAPDRIARPVGLRYIDHVVGNVGWGEMDRWVKFYEDVMGFQLYQHFDDQDISTEYSALMSKVVANGTERIKFPINEPAQGKMKSQIEEYLDYYNGPGVQHIALGAGNIIETVSRLSGQGVEFLYVPSTYYGELSQRVGKIDEAFEQLAELGILVDRDDEGYMLQIFTKPVRGPPDLVFRSYPAQGQPQLREGKFQGVVRSHRARAGTPRESVVGT